MPIGSPNHEPCPNCIARVDLASDRPRDYSHSRRYLHPGEPLMGHRITRVTILNAPRILSDPRIVEWWGSTVLLKCSPGTGFGLPT